MRLRETSTPYSRLLIAITRTLRNARIDAARAINQTLLRTYWEIGRRIVEFEQQGKIRAAYGENLLKRLSVDLKAQQERGFSERNLQLMRLFYLTKPISQTLSAKFTLPNFHLSWSHYVNLLSLDDANARAFYEAESLREGWSVRQLQRQIDSQFFERVLLSKNKAALLSKGSLRQRSDRPMPEVEIKDPYVLEFLNLKDEYSESDLEEALIRHLEHFLLELGMGFTFVGRQKRLRIGDAWYRVDLVLFHRRLKCLVLIDLKLDRFTHADAGQMHLYLNYAKEHWVLPDENPPIGLILCAKKDKAVAHYALDGLPHQVMASEYKMSLPDKASLEAELRKTQKFLGQRVCCRET